MPVVSQAQAFPDVVKARLRPFASLGRSWLWKSVLAKYLIDDYLPQSATICYFFFKDQDQNTIRQALCALLHQLFTHKHSLLRHATVQFDKDGPGLIKSIPSLWTILGNAIKDPQAGPIILVLDALDECAEPDFGILVRYVKSLLISDQMGHGKLKCLLTCRPFKQIVSKFRDRSLLAAFPNIHIPGEEESETISQEVNRVIMHRVDHLSADISRDIKDRLAQKLRETTHRTYLWISLVFDDLEKEDFVMTPSGVESAIATLPRNINEAYERILSKSKDDPMVRKALSAVLVANRPLTLSEMNVAMNIDDKSQCIWDIELENEGDFKSRLRSWCGLFISTHHGKLYLLHQTAREFLLANSASPVHAPSERRWHQSFTAKGAHIVLAKICVLYFNMLNSGFRLPDDENTDGKKKLIVDVLAFLEYAAKNWGIHFRQADIADGSEIVPLALTICDPDSKIHAVWVKAYWKHVCVTPESMTRLMVSSYLGLDAVVKLVLAEGAKLEARDTRYGRTPLSWAAREGHASIVSLLLERGAVIDATDGHGRTPLSLAAENGREAVVKLLLEKEGVGKNSRPSAAFDGGRSPLSYSAQEGHEQVVNMLLSREDVAVDCEDSKGKTPLLYAVAAANSRIARALIGRGANVSRTDYEHKGMLHHAVNNVDSDVDKVKLLIKLGAPTTLVDADNMTPLHYTVRFARTDIAKLLLGYVPVDIAVRRGTWGRDGNYRRNPDATEPTLTSEPRHGLTPLHYAALVGQDEMVSFFLQHKANVNALSNYGETPLHLTLATEVKGTKDQDCWSTDDGKVEVMSDIIDVTDEEEYDEAQRDVLARRTAVFDTLLDDPKADVNIRDHDGETALHKVRYGKLGSSQFVERLLQKNAESTSRYRDNSTPLHLACAARDVQSASLLAPRSQLALSDTKGQNALHLACASACVETMTEVIRACEARGVDLSSTRDSSQRNALHRYAKSFDVNIQGIQRLVDYGVDTGETDVTGDYPISVYLGRRLGSVEWGICRLLPAGVDPKHVDNRGLTFAHLYAVNGYVTVSILKCLDETGVPMSVVDGQGRHLLHHLALHGSLTREVLEFVLSNTDIELEARDDHGQTALRYAEERVKLSTPGSSIFRDTAVVSLQALAELV
ncbi:hypothetical protein EsDP_00002574 [Epichloe bromicola]|uniref:Ankyrin repeat protein n=1 Tax=Epichloe bromicola TaxID=79588 RepID=A0ABQ0CL89_9HYPO